MSLRQRTDSALPAIVLFRHDLRVADNRALSAAADTGKPVIAAYILDESPSIREPGAAWQWWQHRSIEALSAALGRLGIPLLFRRGEMSGSAMALVEESGADLVVWNRRHEPSMADADAGLAATMFAHGIVTQSFEGHLLHEPSKYRTQEGKHYRVFTPFWRGLPQLGEALDPVDAPTEIRPFAKRLRSDRLDDWKLTPTAPDWSGGLAETWTPGEAGARQRLDAFLDDFLDGYGQARDRPAEDSTSRLSPHLAHGEITPCQILAALRARKATGPNADSFRREIAWREFSYHLFCHQPRLAEINFDRRFDDFPWRTSEAELALWKRGQTGYPIVDAGMRQLWQTGWMHNRVRMIAASLLTKHLLIDWRVGESWFWDTLVDADPANNPASWQWVAGSGADASPFFRIFNPVLQGERFDPHGAYVRRYVPELAGLPDAYIHRPWEAPKTELDKAGVKLGSLYPVPVIDHQQARRRALSAFDRIKRS